MKIIRPKGATLDFTEEEKETLEEAGRILHSLQLSWPFDLETLVSENIPPFGRHAFKKSEISKISGVLYGLAGNDYTFE